MKDVKNIELFRFDSERISIHVSASITDDSLCISGHDTGSPCEEFWGDSDYEYFYSLSKEETEKLYTALGGKNNAAETLKKMFGGMDGCEKLSELCRKENISYEFNSYV